MIGNPIWQVFITERNETSLLFPKTCYDVAFHLRKHLFQLYIQGIVCLSLIYLKSCLNIVCFSRTFQSEAVIWTHVTASKPSTVHRKYSYSSMVASSSATMTRMFSHYVTMFSIRSNTKKMYSHLWYIPQRVLPGKSLHLQFSPFQGPNIICCFLFLRRRRLRAFFVVLQSVLVIGEPLKFPCLDDIFKVIFQLYAIVCRMGGK